MKNVKDYQLKKCIFMETEEFDKIIKKLFGDKVEVELSLDGMWIGENGDDCIETPFEEVAEKLASYFEVDKITSIHMDDCDEIGVWICYKED